MKAIRKLSVGDWVEVRSQDEILGTLDSEGRLEDMPFMPEMFAYCGKRFQVLKRAHKTCDTVFPVRGRRLEAVHLDTRCDGSAHGGCQATCLIFWKEAWLRPLADHRLDNRCPVTAFPTSEVNATCPPSCSESTVWSRSSLVDRSDGTATYTCQATQMPYATRPLPWWDIRQYVEDYRSGNVGLRRMVAGLSYAMYSNLIRAGIGLGPAMRWFYDRVHRIWGGPRFPQKAGIISDGLPTPAVTLDLQPGELVRVKSHEEILRTLNTQSLNRGLLFDAEMVPYCGGTYRVLKRVTRIINEKTGKMQEMKNPCIMLEGVFCEARYSSCRMFCPRRIYSYWREAWLERVEAAEAHPERPLDEPAHAASLAPHTG